MIARRRLLLCGAAAASCLAGPAWAALPRERRLSLHNLHTGETLRTAYWAEGRYDGQALAAIDRLLRDHRSGDIHPMDRELIDLLSALQAGLDHAKPLHVVSGYRSPATNAMLAARSSGVAKASLHTRGLAVDIRAPGVPVARLAKAAAALRAGGVGQYPASGFVHVDIGRVRYW